MPEISVIVPVYKVEHLLHRCVDSILCQTFRDFELILVDDGSPDKCGTICDDYALVDKRVRVIHKRNGGLSAARNVGIDIACGKYLCFVDSDDLIHPQLLQILRKSMREHDADMVSTRYISFSTETVAISAITQVKETLVEQNNFLKNLYPSYFEQIGISAWGKLYKRELFNSIRYPEGKIYEDLHIYLQLLRKCFRIVILDTPMYYYYIANESITKSRYLAHNRFDEFIVRLEHADYFQGQGLQEQYDYAINDYLTFFFRNAFAVLLKYREKKGEFEKYMRQHRELLGRIIQNPRICRMRKCCSILIHVCPWAALIVAKRCIPECVLEEMR